MSQQEAIVIIICGVATVISVLVVFKVHLRYLLRTRAMHLGWEQEQLRNQQFWTVQQEKHMRELEAGCMTQMQQLQEAWHHWKAQDAALVATQIRQYEQEIARMDLEYEVLRLPRIEDVPLP